VKVTDSEDVVDEGCLLDEVYVYFVAFFDEFV